MTFDTTQILILALLATHVEFFIFACYVVHTLAGGWRAPTFPVPPGSVTPSAPPVGPGPDVPPVEPSKPPVVPDKPPVPPVPPTPVGHSKILRGPCSFFGGPKDMGVKSDEGLALVERSDFGHGDWTGIFLPTQPPGTTGLARALNPDAHYIACRWDYTETSKKYLQGIKVTVKNPANGKVASDVRPVDWGPGIKTRIADLSPGLMAYLGLNTDDIVEVEIPIPGVAPAQPDTPIQPPLVTGGTVLQKQVWPLQADCPGFYGHTEAEVRSRLVIVKCPWLLNGKTHDIEIHTKCAESLTRVLNYIWERSGKSQEWLDAHGYNIFDGSMNWRLMRGGSSLSMHSFGCATDWDAAKNPQRQAGTFKADSLITEAFEGEGWTWLGPTFDPMHFQAARLR
jgi:hypothetical protein